MATIKREFFALIAILRVIGYSCLVIGGVYIIARVALALLRAIMYFW